MKTKLIALRSFISGSSIKAKILKGSFWLSVGGGSEYALRFFRNILLARILAPDVFGTFALVLAVNTAFACFTEVGIKDAIIQNPNSEEKTYLNAAWWLSVARAMFLYLVGYVASPMIANIYGDPALIPLLRVVFLSVLFQGFMSVKAYVALKQLRYGSWVIIQHVGGVLGVILTICLSLYWENVWALVIGFVAESVFRTLLSHALLPFRPGLRFNPSNTSALLKFAKGVFGLPILYFVFRRADIFVLGKLVEKSTLGVYSMAAGLAEIPSLLLSMTLQPILLPFFSRLKGDQQQLRMALMRVSGFIWLGALPICCFVAFFPGEIMGLLYGPAYRSAAVALVLLFFSTAVRIGSLPFASVYFALGRPELLRKFVFCRAVVMIIFIYPAVVRFGIIGAATTALVANVIAFLLQLMGAKNVIGLNLFQFFRQLAIMSYIAIPVFVGGMISWKFEFSRPILKFIPGLCGLVVAYVFAAIMVSISYNNNLRLTENDRGSNNSSNNE